MNQLSFTDLEYSNRKRLTKREEFLDMMEVLIPWKNWIALIEPFYPKGGRGRPPRGIELMLRMYLLQNWFSLSDEGVEDSIYDSYAMRKFMKIDFTKTQVPDATTLLHFRHLLEENNIGDKLLESVNDILRSEGKLMSSGTIVDATIISAPTSTKNKEEKRDPEMSSTKKGNQWYFGMKAHIGVDAKDGYVHTVVTTAANEHDITVAHQLIREEDKTVYGDAGYIGLDKRSEITKDEDLNKIDYKINVRIGSMKKMDEAGRAGEKEKSGIRAKVEHPFRTIKRTFGFTKTRYRGLKKNTHKLNVLFASANLFKHGKELKKATQS